VPHDAVPSVPCQFSAPAQMRSPRPPPPDTSRESFFFFFFCLQTGFSVHVGKRELLLGQPLRCRPQTAGPSTQASCCLAPLDSCRGSLSPLAGAVACGPAGVSGACSRRTRGGSSSMRCSTSSSLCSSLDQVGQQAAAASSQASRQACTCAGCYYTWLLLVAGLLLTASRVSASSVEKLRRSAGSSWAPAPFSSSHPLAVCRERAQG